jgi:hypothetical protein
MNRRLKAEGWRPAARAVAWGCLSARYIKRVVARTAGLPTKEA